MLAGGGIAGVDEAGRGPLVGPVVASAVIFPAEGCDPVLHALNDSKKLSAKKREFFYDVIFSHAASVGVGFASAQEIDELNILQASFLAMQRALAQLTVSPTEVWVDGNQLPKTPRWPFPSRAWVGGDGKILEIAAASIIAKVTRDRWMMALDADYPGYGFAQHAGYPTAKHLAAIEALGITPEHRRSYGPIRALVASVAE